LYGWSETSTQVFAAPRLKLATLASVGQFPRRSYQATATAPFGPVATDGWNWSVVARLGSGSTSGRCCQLKPPSVDSASRTSICDPSQSSYAT
jgi:hypothetical protein